jgi:cytochrome c peroxidase
MKSSVIYRTRQRRLRPLGLVGVLAVVVLDACADTASEPANESSDTGLADAGVSEEYAWLELPPGFPLPAIPDDNPLTPEKAELGRYLFYDTRLSANQTMSCASCHLQELAFTDGRPQGIGSTGEVHPRSSMSLVNVGYVSTLTWSNPLMTSLEYQALLPMFGRSPVELGMADQEDELFRRLAESEYADLFEQAFPGVTPAISLLHITQALASFQRTLISGNAPFDHYMQGEIEALSPSELRGLELFFSERAECFHCHGGFTFSDSVDHTGLAETARPFHNTGLYNLDGQGAYPGNNQGILEVTGRAEDMGAFRAPTLRNIAVTAPYMHDGSIADLNGVIDHYAAGGRTISEGEFAGVGSDSPLKSPLVRGFVLSESERADLIAFLESLTDETLLTNPRFSNPFIELP